MRCRARYSGVCMMKGEKMGQGDSVTLRDIRIGGSARVLKLTGVGALKRHVMDMGVTKGVTVTVRKVAPLGDPIEIEIRGYNLSIRKDDAKK